MRIKYRLTQPAAKQLILAHLASENGYAPPKKLVTIISIDHEAITYDVNGNTGTISYRCDAEIVSRGDDATAPVMFDVE